jgi:hypothetical protein
LSASISFSSCIHFLGPDEGVRFSTVSASAIIPPPPHRLAGTTH